MTGLQEWVGNENSKFEYRNSKHQATREGIGFGGSELHRGKRFAE
jgi:hypothetical protein